MSRRRFLLRSAAVLGGVSAVLIVGWGVLPPRSRLGAATDLPVVDDAVALNGWVRIQSDGSAVLIMPRAEMGQGAYTGLTTLLAEELDLPLDRISLEQAPNETIYGNVAMLVGALPFHPLDKEAEDPSLTIRAAEWIVSKVARELGVNVTGGSSTMSDAWDVLRLAGASARGALLAAGAERFGVTVNQLITDNGRVIAPDGTSAHYGELIQAAAELAPADAIEPKPAAQWRLIGQPVNRVDIPSKVDGTAQFGIDVRLPGMKFASVMLCPTLGGELNTVDADELIKRPGVDKVVTLPPLAGTSGGFAVIASHTWTANQATLAAKPTWQHGPNAAVSTITIMSELDRALREDDGFSFYSLGDADAAFERAPNKIDVSYQVPHLAHATLEPMNATAWFHDDVLEVWAPTQVPGLAAMAAAKAAGLDSEQVRLHATLLGGGFGRRLETDYVAAAAVVAMAMPGQPVQTVWSREQDMTHDFYRPAQVVRLQAGVSADGQWDAFKIRSAGDSVIASWMNRSLPIPGGGPDKTTAEGLFDQAYGVPNQSMSHVKTSVGVPIGFWRSVGHSLTGFIMESFVDEVADALGQDPVAFRLSLLDGAPRHAAVLKLAAEKSDWAKPLPVGRSRGVALHESFGSIVAQVAEVSIIDGQPHVHEVTCAIDCGLAVNPDIVKQQMESGVIFGLTAALYGQIDIKDGQVQQQNFPDYRLLPLDQAPRVTTHIVESERPPRGVGEPGLPPIAAAVSNALFKLTAIRQRRLPLRVA